MRLFSDSHTDTKVVKSHDQRPPRHFALGLTHYIRSFRSYILATSEGMDEFTIYNNVSALPSNLYLYIFTGKLVRSPPFSNIHVENLKFPRGYFLFSTWPSFISSEVSFDSSEEFFISYLGNKNSPRGNFEISTWRSLFPDTAPYRYVVGSKLL